MKGLFTVSNTENNNFHGIHQVTIDGKLWSSILFTVVIVLLYLKEMIVTFIAYYKSIESC